MRGVLLMDVPVGFGRGRDISYVPPTPARLGIGSWNKSSGPVLSDARGKIFVPEKFVRNLGQAGRLSYAIEDVGTGVALTRRFANACAHHAKEDFGTGGMPVFRGQAGRLSYAKPAQHLNSKRHPPTGIGHLLVLLLYHPPDVIEGRFGFAGFWLVACRGFFNCRLIGAKF